MNIKKSAVLIGLTAITLVSSGALLFALSDTSGYDPNKEYRCPGVCKIQDIFGITPD